MAEGFANHHAAGCVKAWSAGASPLGWIAPYTFTVMEEKGICLDGQWSKRVQDVPAADMDVAVYMGVEVACRLPDGFKGRRVDWEIPDPFGSDVEVYRVSRNLIEERVRELLAELGVKVLDGVSPK
jgi:arsenate reductase (thioredoxin)